MQCYQKVDPSQGNFGLTICQVEGSRRPQMKTFLWGKFLPQALMQKGVTGSSFKNGFSFPGTNVDWNDQLLGYCALSAIGDMFLFKGKCIMAETALLVGKPAEL